MNKKCYFKRLVESSSKEAENYKTNFQEVDFKQCLYKCTGYQGYGTCEHFTLELNKGLLERLIWK